MFCQLLASKEFTPVFDDVFFALLLFEAICNRPAPAAAPLTSLVAASRNAAFASSGVEPGRSEK